MWGCWTSYITFLLYTQIYLKYGVRSGRDWWNARRNIMHDIRSLNSKRALVSFRTVHPSVPFPCPFLSLHFSVLLLSSLLFPSLPFLHFQPKNITEITNCQNLHSERSYQYSITTQVMSAIRGIREPPPRHDIILVTLAQCLAPHHWESSNIQYQWIDLKLSREENAWADSPVKFEPTNKTS